MRYGKYIIKPMWEERDYILFGILAGVRCNDVNTIAHPRGLPKSVTDFVKSEYDKYDHYHSASYLSADEIFRRYYEERDHKTDKFGCCLGSLEEFSRAIEDRMTDVFEDIGWTFGAERDERIRQRAKDFRIVFWFDD